MEDCLKDEVGFLRRESQDGLIKGRWALEVDTV